MDLVGVADADVSTPALSSINASRAICVNDVPLPATAEGRPLELVVRLMFDAFISFISVCVPGAGNVLAAATCAPDVGPVNAPG